MKFENVVVLEGRSAIGVSLTANTANASVILEAGIYAVWSDQDTKIRVDRTEAGAETVTLTNGFPLQANSAVVPVKLSQPGFLGGIAAVNATLYYHRVA